jgi:hypothetical protein
MKTLNPFSLLVDLVERSLDRHYAALELVSAQGTAINTTIAALAAVSGDSLAVKNTGGATPARLLQLWADVQLAGTLRVRSSKFHDNVQGIRVDTIASDCAPLLPWGVSQRVYPNDTLIVELAGSSTAGDIEYVSLLIYYPDLPGTSLQSITREQLVQRALNIMTVENTLATGTGGGWTGSEAINAEIDQFHAGGLYALVGYKVDAECASVGIRGADTANLRIGGPGIETEPELTADWFGRLSDAFKLPLIPVFSAENKAGILVDALQDENGTDVTVTWHFVEISR